MFTVTEFPRAPTFDSNREPSPVLYHFLQVLLDVLYPQGGRR